MARNPKPLRYRPKNANKRRREYPRAERKAFRQEYLERVKKLVPGARVEACGSMGTILEREGPHVPHYTKYGKYYLEYDLFVAMDYGGRSWHGLVDCCKLPNG